MYTVLWQHLIKIVLNNIKQCTFVCIRYIQLQSCFTTQAFKNLKLKDNN